MMEFMWQRLRGRWVVLERESCERFGLGCSLFVGRERDVMWEGWNWVLKMKHSADRDLRCRLI